MTLAQMVYRSIVAVDSVHEILRNRLVPGSISEDAVNIINLYSRSQTSARVIRSLFGVLASEATLALSPRTPNTAATYCIDGHEQAIAVL